VSVRVQLPPGCEGFTGGSERYRARPGGVVTVSDEDARKLDAMPGNGTAGLVTARSRVFAGTRKSRWCFACTPARVWNAWTTRCHRCGGATQPGD
jgi:hypothetical protein